jgi:inosine-uridine nucleoside N-ribohydrolase
MSSKSSIPTAHLPDVTLAINRILFSDAGALLLAATSPDVNLLAVNINYPSSYSAVAASAILSHYGKAHVPIGIRRPLTSATFFDSWYFELGEYASKVAYHFSGGSLPWGRAEDAWDPVALYRQVLAEAEDGSVTIASIGFLDTVRFYLVTQSHTLHSTCSSH